MTKTSAASNGSTASEPEYGLMVLREKEARGLIGLACDAMSQTSSVVHDLHQALYSYGEAAESDRPDRLKVLNEALGCLRATEHYLLMLSSVFEEQDHGVLDRWSPDPAF